MACTGKKCAKSSQLTEEQHKILTAIAADDAPCGSKEITARSGMTSQKVSSNVKSLKSQGYIDSPARCKYCLTPAGKSILAS